VNTEVEVMVDAQVHIRWVIRRDMEEVMRIENACFEFPWSEEDYHRVLTDRSSIGLVAEVNECVVASVMYELCPNAIRVLNFAVRPDCQRRGIGTALVNKLKGKLSNDRRRRITLHTRETNIAAQKFFSSQGFRAIGIAKEFYLDSPEEDAYLFQYRLPVCTGK